MSLPYENSTAGKRALDDIEKTLESFGATSFGVMKDFNNGALIVQFEYRNRKMEIKASAKGYATAWLKQNPYTNRMRKTLDEHKEIALKKGQVATYSILRDWIKGQITAIETGILSFEGAFLGQILLDNGFTVMDQIQSQGLLPPPEEEGQ